MDSAYLRGVLLAVVLMIAISQPAERQLQKNGTRRDWPSINRDYVDAIEACDRAIALDPQSVEAKQNRERAVTKVQGSKNATLSTPAMPAGEPVPFMNLLALAVGAVGLAGTSRVRRG